MPIRYDVGAHGRRSLTLYGGKPILKNEHKYYHHLFLGMLAEARIEEQDDEITSVTYSWPFGDGSLTDEMTPCISHKHTVDEHDRNRLTRAYANLASARENPISRQHGDIYDSFYMPSPEEDPEAYRLVYDPVQGRRRLVLLWGTLPPHIRAWEPPVHDRKTREDAIIAVMKNDYSRWADSPWLKRGVWILVCALCLLLLLLALRPLFGNRGDDSLSLDNGDVPELAEEFVGDDDDGEERGADQPLGLARRLLYVVFPPDESVGETDAATAVVNDGRLAEQGEMADHVNEPDSFSANAETHDETDPSAGEAPPPGELPSSGDLYVRITGSSGEAIVRVTLGPEPQLRYLASREIDSSVINGLDQTRRSSSGMTPGSRSRTIWVPESREVLDQVEQRCLTMDDAPVRRRDVPTTLSTASFMKLLLNEDGRLVGQVPVTVTAWDR